MGAEHRDIHESTVATADGLRLGLTWFASFITGTTLMVDGGYSAR